MKNQFNGFQSVETKLSNFLKPIFNEKKSDFILINNLTKNWKGIIGEKYYNFCYPKSISFAKDNSRTTLTIGVYNAAVGFFLESNYELIIERIAVFYGFKSVKKIIIKQEPKRVDLSNKTEDKLTKEQKEFLQKSIKEIKNEDLAATLERLGKEILNDDNKNNI